MREIKKAEAYDGSEYDLTVHMAAQKPRAAAASDQEHVERGLGGAEPFPKPPSLGRPAHESAEAWFACAARCVNSDSQPLESRFVVSRAGAITVGGSRCLREDPRMGQIGHLGHQWQVVTTEAG